MHKIHTLYLGKVYEFLCSFIKVIAPVTLIW